MTDGGTMEGTSEAVYGLPPGELVAVASTARQLSPLIPGAASIDAAADASFDRLVVLAPPGTIERRWVFAAALRVLKPGGALVALAPKTRGGRRMASELAEFGCEIAEDSRRHFRIVETVRPDRPAGLADALAAGALRFDAELGLWTQAGVFSADRIDPGSRLLVDHLPKLAGRGADLGCGLGVLGRAVLESEAVRHLILVDIDRRAVEAARRNVEDPRADIRWADLREPQDDLEKLDFAVSNPPFHDAGSEDRLLGQTFIRQAARMLKTGGILLLVANRHLPYEDTLNAAFKRVSTLAEANGYKLFEARR